MDVLICPLFCRTMKHVPCHALFRRKAALYASRAAHFLSMARLPDAILRSPIWFGTFRAG
jgi:hypothetical protein